MSAKDHAVLLDALEAAGFPRAAISGAGNAIVQRGKGWQVVVVAPGPDGQMRFDITVDESELTYRFDRQIARRLGAFLLAWGYEEEKSNAAND